MMASVGDSATLEDFSNLLDSFLFETDAHQVITRCAGAFPHGLAQGRTPVGMSLDTLIQALHDDAARHAIARLAAAREKISRLRYSQGALGDAADDYEISIQPLFAGEEFAGLRGIISPVPKRPRADIAREARSTLLSSVSHELRTPLNAILGFAEIMRGELLGPLGTPQYRDYMADIQASGRHLLQMVDDILDIARMEGGEVQLRAEAVDVAAAVHSCINIHREELAERGIGLDVDLEDDLPDIWGDAHAVRQMLLNLLANSAAFVEPGGAITVSAKREADRTLNLRVSDTGIGIDADQLEYVLLPFLRPDHRLARGHGGTGLGLPITKALLDLHDGRIDIRSTVGRGTEVTLVFPHSRLVETHSRTALLAG